MSSGISTDDVRLKPDTTHEGVRGVGLQADLSRQANQSLQPWQFFLLAGLGCATAVVFVARGQGVATVLLLSVLMATAVLVGVAALRMLRPLVTSEDDRTPMVGHRTRLALEREKALVLRSIKELEFDRAMGKLSEADWQEMSGRLRARAIGLMRQLDAGAGYREQIERDLDTRLKNRHAPPIDRACANCRTVNDPDARFCKSCGQKL